MRGFLYCLEDFRRGGLGRGGDRRDLVRPFCASVASGRSTPLTVDEDDEDVSDSRKAGSPCVLALSRPSWCAASPSLLLVIGGRLRKGLSCLGLDADFEGAKTIPGEWEDIEVGVEVLLKGPGDSE